MSSTRMQRTATGYWLSAIDYSLYNPSPEYFKGGIGNRVAGLRTHLGIERDDLLRTDHGRGHPEHHARHGRYRFRNDIRNSGISHLLRVELVPKPEHERVAVYALRPSALEEVRNRWVVLAHRTDDARPLRTN